MKIDELQRNSFLKFCQRNRRFWEIHSFYDAEPIVLVDVNHCDVAYVTANCFIGSSLANMLQARKFGITGSPEASQGTIDKQNLYEIADSYLYSGFFDAVMDTGNQHYQFATKQLEKLRNDVGSDFEAIATYQLDGIALGHCIVEDYCRRYRCPCIEEFDERLERVIREAFYNFSYFDELFSTYDVRAYVTGHNVYTFWGVLCEIALKRNVSVYLTRKNCHTSLFAFHPEKIKSLDLFSEMSRVNGELFQNEIKPHRNEWIKAAETAFEYKKTGEFLQPSWWDRQLTAGEVDVTDIKKRFGIDPAKQVITIFSHCLSDANLCNNSVYKSYLEWTEEILKLAARVREKHWIFKIHPHNEVYDYTGRFEEMRNAYGHLDHVTFLSKEISRNELFALTDVATTICGSIGYDIVTFGKNSVICGEANYSGFEFGLHPRTAAEMSEILSDANLPSRATPEQVENAKLFFLFDYGLSDLPCDALPPSNPCDYSNYFSAAYELIRSYIPDRDRMFQSLKRLALDREERVLLPVESIANVLPVDDDNGTLLKPIIKKVNDTFLVSQPNSPKKPAVGIYRAELVFATQPDANYLMAFDSQGKSKVVSVTAGIELPEKHGFYYLFGNGPEMRVVLTFRSNVGDKPIRLRLFKYKQRLPQRIKIKELTLKFQQKRKRQVVLADAQAFAAS